MSRSPAPSSASRARAVDARDWLGGIRFSGFAAIMLSLVVLGVFVLAPTVGRYVEQRQKIAALQEAVAVTHEQIADLERERARWGDKAYIMTQARERLYYVMPGDVVYWVVDDLEETELPVEPDPVSAEVEESQSDWMSTLLHSFVGAGLAKQAVDITVGVPDPEPTEDPAG